MAPRGRTPKVRTTEFGLYLAHLREQQGLNLLDLADKSGINHKTLSRLESGAHPPRKPDLLMKLAVALDVHPNRLLLRAALTPILAPMPVVAPSDKRLWQAYVTGEEKDQLEDYLIFLRYSASLR